MTLGEALKALFGAAIINLDPIGCLCSFRSQCFSSE